MTIADPPAEAPPAESLGSESFEELYEFAPCGFIFVTLAGTIVRVNQTLLNWTGHTRSDLVGASIFTLLAKGSQLFYETRFVPVLRLEGHAREISLELRRSDGTSLHVLTNSTVVPSEDGGPEIVRTAVFDSTERHTYERDLVDARRRAEASEARVRVLQDASTAFGDSERVEDVALALAASAREAFAATETSVMLMRDSGELYVAAGVHPLLEFLPENELERGSEAIRMDGVFVLSNRDDAEAFRPAVSDAMRRARIESITATPIQSDLGLFGVLHCSFARAREFDPAYFDLNQALARQASQVIARLRLQEQLAREALHDQLTGLANRTLLQERTDESIAGAVRTGISVAVLFVDLDGFKAVNDHLGHVIGDSALRQVSARIRGHVRPTDVVGRFGGDEFVVVCPESDEDAAMVVAERIRESIARPLDGVPEQYRVTASVGIALWDPTGSDVEADALFRAADEAMYRSKNAGKDCVTLVRV
jgi:diguanylate cyclase (GGDEF)-like protein/PAS domain S-box-containing protein